MSNITGKFIASYSAPRDLNSWIFILMILNQNIGYSTISAGGPNLKIMGEFRMDSQDTLLKLGSNNNTSFQGFIANLFIRINQLCRRALSSLPSCNINQYSNASQCINCPVEVLNYSCIRNSQDRCYSINCTSCSGYNFEDCVSASLLVSKDNLGATAIQELDSIAQNAKQIIGQIMDCVYTTKQHLKFSY